MHRSRTQYTVQYSTATDEFDHPKVLCTRFQELTQVWVISLLLLLDHVYETTYRSTYMILYLTLVELCWLLKTYLFR